MENIINECKHLTVKCINCSWLTKFYSGKIFTYICGEGKKLCRLSNDEVNKDRVCNVYKKKIKPEDIYE